MNAPDDHPLLSEPWWRDLLGNRNLILLGAVLLIGLVFQALTWNDVNSFLSARSLATVLTQAAVIGVIACGMTFIIVLTHIDLSVGSAIALFGALAAWALAPPPVTGVDLLPGQAAGLGLPMLVVLPGILLLTLLTWGAMGLLQHGTGMPAFIITLGGMMAFRGLTYLVAPQEIPIAPGTLLDHLGTGTMPLVAGWILVAAVLGLGLWQLLRQRAQGRPGWRWAATPFLLIAGVLVFLQLPHAGVHTSQRGIAWLIVAWLAIALALAALGEGTVMGRHIYAVGGNREAARLCGIRVGRVTVVVFCCMGLVVGCAALMYVGQQGTAESGAGTLLELDAIAACVLGGVSLMGGRGSIAGAVLGALIMQSLTAGLLQCGVETGYQMVIKAAVLIAVVAVDHVLGHSRG